MWDASGHPNYVSREPANKNPRPCGYFGVIDRRTNHRRACLGAAMVGRRNCRRHQLEENHA